MADIKAGDRQNGMMGWQLISLLDNNDGSYDVRMRSTGVGDETDAPATPGSSASLIAGIKGLMVQMQAQSGQMAQLIAINNALLARLNAGIKTQTVVSVPVTINV